MNLLHSIYFVLLYSTAIIFIIKYRQMPVTLKPLIVYLIFSVVVNSLAMFMVINLHVSNNLFLFHFTTPLEYITLCLVFYYSFESLYIKKAILLSIPVLVVLSAIFSMFLNKLSENNTYARIAEALFTTVWILQYFRQLSTTDKILNVKRDPMFWVYTGLLFYFWGTLFLQGFLSRLVESDPFLARRYYTIQMCFEYILFIGIIIGVFCKKIFSSLIKA